MFPRPTFMESEGSLPFSEEVASGPYPEQDESSLHRLFHLLLGLPNGLFRLQLYSSNILRSY